MIYATHKTLKCGDLKELLKTIGDENSCKIFKGSEKAKEQAGMYNALRHGKTIQN